MIFQDRIYGKVEITEPVILELLATPQLERLKKVHQQGNYFIPFPEFAITRFEHSVGVMLLLNRFGATLAEQIAGLLHDISHGSFSHVLDHLYGKTKEQDYQDTIHQNFFDENLKKLLKKHNLDWQLIADLEHWPLLDNPLPDICADRLDYTLRDAFMVGHINDDFIKEVLNDLRIKNDKFVFQNFDLALKFANVSYWMCRHIWHVEWGEALFQLMAKVLAIALERKIITERDLNTDDGVIMEKLEKAGDEQIAGQLLKIKNIKKDGVINNPNDYDFFLASKNRVIDPLLATGAVLKRVSELNADFKKKYLDEKERVKAMYLKILD